MMKSLRPIKRRVQALAERVGRVDCVGQHQQTHVSYVDGDDEEPVWPEPGSPDRCTCGRKIIRTHVVHRFFP